MFSSSILNRRVVILQPVLKESEFGFDSATPAYRKAYLVWANVRYVKGVRAMSNGDMVSYNTQLIKMRYYGDIANDWIGSYQGQRYAITSINGDERANELQLTVQQLPELTRLTVIDD